MATYISLADAKRQLDIADAADDAILERLITATSALIDSYTNRRFDNAVETRYYTPEDIGIVRIDDLVSATEVKTDDNADGSYETTWTAGTDYVPLPENASTDGLPFNHVSTTPWGTKSFPVGTLKGLRVVGTWGFPAVPEPVKIACLIQVTMLYRAKEAPFGVIGSAETGIIRLGARLHPEAALLLEPYRRRTGLAW
jgi:hypothetical protein